MVSIPTIPEFANTPEELATTLRSLKDAVEQLGGLRQGQSRGAPQVYVQAVTPSASRRISFKVGDLWINTTTDKLNYWTGSTWRELL